MLSNMKLFYPLFLVFFGFYTQNSFALPNEIKFKSDIAYGKSDQQILDVYYPSVKRDEAPVIFMVHGGAWRIGDKASTSVVKNKVAHWVPKGFIFISVNYPMLPEARPLEQAEYVEKALIFSQRNIHRWGGSPEKFILMGHSAGAHLVSLVSVRNNAAIKPWLGTVSLDSAAYDVEKIMNAQSPARFYKKAFGTNPAYWKRASPIHVLTNKLPPFLAVCSTKRKEDACIQAKHFVEKAQRYDNNAKILPVAFSHRGINEKLGSDYCYTREIDGFLNTLDSSIKSMLLPQSNLGIRGEVALNCD
jgi:acetyl esterase/lipase